VSLLEALTGTNFEIKHLDGKKIKVIFLILDYNFTKGCFITWGDKMCEG